MGRPKLIWRDGLTGTDKGVNLTPETSPVTKESATEIITTDELARRLALSIAWIRDHMRKRSSDRIPYLKFGRLVRFEWNSPELNAWIDAHRRKSSR